MIRKHKARDGTITYGVRVYRDGERVWVGTFEKLGAAHGDPDTEARAAESRAKSRPTSRRAMTCGEYAERFLAEYEDRCKDSSIDTAKRSLKPFLRRFGRVPLADIERLEAKEWAKSVKPSYVPIVVTLMNAAVEDELLERNPFRGLGQRTRGRADQDPPSEEEFGRLLEACAALKGYAPTMRALLSFAAYTGMRPGELYELEWGDIDFDRMRIAVERRLYRGRVAKPKSGEREIALTPPARDAILGRLVFHAKRGGRLSQSLLSGYWAQVLARAGLDFDFYLATKHYCAHYLWATLGLPERVVAEQLGHALDRELRWKLRKVYGHGEVGALEELDAAFGRNVTPLRPQAVDGGADA
jgi:integrase